MQEAYSHAAFHVGATWYLWPGFERTGINVSILKNKHLAMAMLMAPVLALVSYYAVNAIVSETPHAAEAGQSYQLAEKPNCRRGGGNCSLKNGDFELELSVEWFGDDRMLLKLGSVHPLDGVLVSLVENEADDKRPVEMRPMGDDGLVWSLDMARPNPERHRLHLVASSNQSLYFGDVAMKFTLKNHD
jgi:hypothetical protein